MTETSSLIPVLSAAISLLLGGGGIAGALTWWTQRKRGIRQDDREDLAELSKQAHDILSAQVEHLVKPMQAELERLRIQMTALEEEVKSARTQYWQAIGYIRDLYSWSKKHMPQDAPDPPTIPPSLIKDI